MARVGMDLDGVLYAFEDALRHFVQNYEPWASIYADVDLPPSTRWEFYLDWGMTAEEFVQACNDGVNSGVIFCHGEPLDDAKAQLHRLHDAGHTIHIITDRSFGRPGQSKQNTLAWLHYHAIPYDTIDFTADKTSVPVDTMLDDKLENYLALDTAGVVTWLRHRPWNEGTAILWRQFSLAGFVDSVLLQYGEQAVHKAVEVIAAEAGVPLRMVAPDVEVRLTSSTGGEKGSKLARYDLIPAEPLRMLAELYGAGAAKYADRNWELGYDWSLSFAAMQRHAWQFWNGEDVDPQPPHAPHMAAVVFHAFTLLEFMATHREFDNRPSTLTAAPSASVSDEAA